MYLLAEDGSHSKDSEITTGYPEFDHVLLKKLGWWGELTTRKKQAAEGKNWKTDLSGGIQRVAMNHGCHLGQRQGARGGVELPGCGAAAPRADLRPASRPGGEVPDPRRQEGVSGGCRRSTRRVQQKNVDDKVYEKFPIILTSGRLVEYEGGGEETRSNPWLAELQQENFVEINPKAAADRGIRNGD